MRTIINISVPKETAAAVKRAAREDGFTSVSEYFRHLVREENRRKLVANLNRQRAQYLKNPKAWKVLRSLKDLR